MTTIKIILIILSISLLGDFNIKAEDNRTQYFPKVEVKPEYIPAKENVWVFIMAGQSNMAGRGLVEPIDTVPDKRILSINKTGEVIVAKEPLHFYEPSLTGLDCGLAFGRELLNHIPDNISILLVPTAVGGSSIDQWLNDSTFRNVALLSNFREKMQLAKNYGVIKGVLWHQGESDANSRSIPLHQQKLKKLFDKFRDEADNRNLPIIIGELGSFSRNNDNWQAMNRELRQYVASDNRAYLISTGDLNHKGDKVHFDSEGQRVMGKRFAREFINSRSPEKESGRVMPSSIKIYKNNPFYWEYNGAPTLLLGGSSEDNLFNHPGGLKEQLDLLHSVGGNYIRNTMSSRNPGNPWPHKKLENGLYDLNQWNEEYWQRFQNLLDLCLERDIIVQIEIWDPWDYFKTEAPLGYGPDNVGWESCPYNPQLNINYTTEESGLATEIDYYSSRTPSDHVFFHTVPELKDKPLVREYQEAFVEKMLSISLDYPNVLYCMNNEIGEPAEWGEYWARFIRNIAEMYIPDMLTPIPGILTPLRAILFLAKPKRQYVV